MEKMKYGPYEMPGKGYEMPEMGVEQQAPMMYSAPMMQHMPSSCCYGTPTYGRGNSFALFVVLFILLIIIGAACKF
ncbi:hypothetical protein CIB95_06945 [Lottiidibacillus patelloidae]|uniref:Sporulation protein YjcZ n=1 Tax=Lottiidibacillus patelloidae TaxID=2670334 RepID=A0A263BVK0_9BACI|nr:YjcZ family sporulation protein [Lottiidibacillus patelloidae]OZM57196.1 hypothetical protein CIB95_06945 [Lottiidibacillus patelloidae]